MGLAAFNRQRREQDAKAKKAADVEKTETKKVEVESKPAAKAKKAAK